VFLAGTWFALDWGVLGLVSAQLVAYIAQGVWGGTFTLLWIRSSAKAAC
jgi:hypothetical protein